MPALTDIMTAKANHRMLFTNSTATLTMLLTKSRRSNHTH